MKTPPMRLGRGLDALINTDDVKTDGGSAINEIDIEFIEPNPSQPRTDFDEEALKELAASIKENGIISPITLRQINEKNYQIIAGERRFRASKLAGLTKIPAYIRTADDEQMQVMALIENIQRADLNAIEIALGYQKAMTDFGLTQEKLGGKVGKKREIITHYLGLLKLPAEIQLAIKEQKISVGHAKTLSNLDAAEQLKVYDIIVNQGLNVRKTEDFVKTIKNSENKEIEKIAQKREKKPLSTEYQNYKEEIKTIFNTGVNIGVGEDGKGKITISFADEDDLNRIMSILDKLK